MFLLLAVPMALMLDEIGFFAAVAARIDHGRRLFLWLWIFAAAVTTLFNLDASVVLLTPLANDTDVMVIIDFEMKMRSTGRSGAMTLHHWWRLRDRRSATTAGPRTRH